MGKMKQFGVSQIGMVQYSSRLANIANFDWYTYDSNEQKHIYPGNDHHVYFDFPCTQTNSVSELDGD